MDTEQPPSHRASEADTRTRCDDVDMLMRSFALPLDAETTTTSRWEHLAERIQAHRYLQALHAHMSICGSEVRRTALLLRPWTTLAVQIA